MIVPVVLISDDNYALATSVAVESIVKNKAKDTIYKIYILGIDFSEENRKKLVSQSRKNADVAVINLENKYKDIKYTHSYISKAVFYKFDIANIFEQYDKIIFLDGDVIVNADLSELYSTELKDNYAAGVEDLILYRIKRWNESVHTDSYFNSGVCVLNAQKIREDNLYPRFIEEYTQNNWPHSDQDVFNIMFNKKVEILSLKYNFINLYLNIDDFSNFSDSVLNDFKSSAKNPVIIHYAGDKPWNLKKGPFFNIWKKYFKTSPYKNEKLKWQKNKKLFEFNCTNERIKIRVFGIGFNLQRGNKSAD